MFLSCEYVPLFVTINGGFYKSNTLNVLIKACINQGVLLLNVNPMLIFVPCRFWYQFISISSSIFLFIYFIVYIFCLMNYILLLLLLIKHVWMYKSNIADVCDYSQQRPDVAFT